MRRMIVTLAAALAAGVLTAATSAQTPTERPFPGPKVASLFVSSHVVTAADSALGAGVLTNHVKRGETAVFRVFLGDLKTGRVLTGKDVKYAYVKIPGAPNVKLAYRGSSGNGDAPARWTFSGSWTVPAGFKLGLMEFKVLVKSNAKRYGSFLQIPVDSALLTVTAS